MWIVSEASILVFEDFFYRFENLKNLKAGKVAPSSTFKERLSLINFNRYHFIYYETCLEEVITTRVFYQYSMNLVLLF